MDHKPLPVGVDLFEKLITQGYYFVDKTLLIKDLLDNKGEVNLFTRPRRFGKTLNVSMLKYFFEDARKMDGTKQDNRYLFEGLNIMQAGETYLSHMGQYSVINLSLKSAKQPDFELAYAMLKREIEDEFGRHRFILDGALSEKDKLHFKEIYEGNADRDSFNGSLKFLS